MMDYLIVKDAIIENIIVCETAEIAAQLGAIASYAGAKIGDKYAPPSPPAAVLREDIYNTEPIIDWNGSKLTVTEASTLWQYYAAEGSAQADVLQKLIASAKAEIRERFPDEGGDES